MKDVLQVAAVLFVEAILFVALRVDAKDRRARLEGIPTIATPLHPAWALATLLPVIPGTWWLVHKQDWLMVVMQLLLALTTSISIYLHARRLGVACVPADQISSWIDDLKQSLRLHDRPVRITDRWQESRTVTLEIPSGSRGDLLRLHQALRPLVQRHPSPGPWKNPYFPTQFVRPMIIAIMVLFPVALLLIRLDI